MEDCSGCDPAGFARSAHSGRPGRSFGYPSGGIDDRPVETEHEAKSIGHEDTYDHDLRERGAMRRELLLIRGLLSA